jgi:hypothetical protein
MEIKKRNERIPFRYMIFLQLGLALFLPHLLFASEFSAVGHKSIKGFEAVYSHTSRGLGFQVVGKSLLSESRIQKTSRVRLNNASPVKKAFLIWSGETKEENKNRERITFLTDGNKEYSITAQQVWKQNSTGILYSAFADVTKYVTGSGLYGVKDLHSDMVNPGGRDPYTVAGWALVTVTEDPASREKNSITLLAGLQVLKPGETYDLSLTPYAPSAFPEPRAIGVIGGHGRAGNGSSNLLNNKALSEKEDWDGSAGKFWDVDNFNIRPDTNSDGDKGLTLTIDPLLQWLYPVGVVVTFKSHE